ncbi:hypothetical protein BDI4_310006 [Burkholderia diffusa]|nr:hypothetical protein BDI4_310006 [Burkholderia diffusa]
MAGEDRQDPGRNRLSALTKGRTDVRPFYFSFSLSRAARYPGPILITRKRQARQGFEAWLFPFERLSFGF